MNVLMAPAIVTETLHSALIQMALINVIANQDTGEKQSINVLVRYFALFFDSISNDIELNMC